MFYIYLSKKIRLSVHLIWALFLWLVLDAGTLLPIFASVALHEAGHMLAGRELSLRISSFTLTPLGAIIEYEKPLTYREDIALAAAGVFTSLVLAGLGLTVSIFFPVLLTFSYFSLCYGILNLLPVSSLDGGRVLRGILYLRLSYCAAGYITDIISFFFLLILWLLGVFLLLYTSFNISLMLVCSYLFTDVYLHDRK